MKQQFVCDAGGKKLGSRIIGAVPHRFSALSGRQTFAADIDLPAAWLLQPRQRHGKGSFARAVFTSDGGNLPGRQSEIQVFKNDGLFSPAGQIPAEKVFLPGACGKRRQRNLRFRDFPQAVPFSFLL